MHKNPLTIGAVCVFLLGGCGGGSSSNDDTGSEINTDSGNTDAGEEFDSNSGAVDPTVTSDSVDLDENGLRDSVELSIIDYANGTGKQADMLAVAIDMQALLDNELGNEADSAELFIKLNHSISCLQENVAFDYDDILVLKLRTFDSENRRALYNSLHSQFENPETIPGDLTAVACL